MKTKSYTLALLLWSFFCAIAAANTSQTYEDWTSTNHEDGSSSSFTWNIEVSEPTTLFFEWSVSSESGYDFLRVSLDGNIILEKSGDEHTLFSCEITAGSHTLEASYSKDGSSSNGSDQASIFNITLGSIEYPEISNDIFTRTDVDVSITNGGTHGWTESEAGIITNRNCGTKYSTSLLTVQYQSEHKTELSFDWRSYNSSNHSALSLLVDGVQVKSTNNSSYNSVRLYVEPGQHVIVFRDSIGNSTSTSNYSYIKNIKIKEILPLETAALSENSQPLTFTNDGAWPWTIEDGYIQNSNYGTANSSSWVSTTFEINEPSKFSFQRQVTPYNTYWNSSTSSYPSYQYFYTKINGETYMTDWDNSGWDICSVMLEPGKYTIEWLDTIANTTTSYYSRIRNIELSSNWVEADLSTAGTLGVEVLYLVSVLNDVELLKVRGPINSTDWATIKQMNNLLALDLSDAIVTSVPNNAFDGLNRLSNVKLPEGVKSIGEYAFRGTQIWNISIPSSVTSIGQYAFASTRLKSISFAEQSNLQSIAQYAFQYCSSMQEFKMPSTVTTVGQYAFRGCTSLRSLWFSDEITTINRSVCYDCTQLTSLHLPVNLSVIGRNAFYNNYSLTSLVIPESLNEIRYEAFYNCALDSLKLPIALENLSEYAFSHCWKLKYIEMPSYLYTGSWYDENSDYSYYGYRNNFNDCDAIETIVMRSATPPSITNDPFSNGRAKSSITLKVPSFAVVNYKLDNYWYQFGSIVEGDDIDYWKITSPLSLTNNRRMQGKPDIDLYYGGQFTVGGNAPMEIGEFNIYVNESNPGRLLNTCEAMTADDINTYYSVESEKWYFFTPLHDVDLTKVSVSNGASYVFRYYDGDSRATNGTGNSWRNVDNGKLIAGQGYIFRCNANAVLTMPTGYLKSIAPMTDEAVWEARVSYTIQSGSDWTSPSFDDSSWDIQQAAWGTADDYEYPNVRNPWVEENSDIYVRRIVNLTADDLEKNLWIKFSHDDDFELYINGTRIITTGPTWIMGETYRLTFSEKGILHIGENVFAAHCHNGGGRAYIDFGLYEKNPTSENFAQVFTTTDVTKQLNAYEAAASANKSWNYVGNPYPCYYDIYYMDFTAPITVWTGSTYKAYSIVDDNYALRPMQSFFVQKPDAVDNIVFHKEGRQLTADINHAAGVKEFAPSHQNRYFFDLQILGDKTMDETRVVLNDEASLGYEIERDASKFMSFESAVPQMFTLDSDDNFYAINERPLADGQVSLAYYAGQTGYYTISATRVDGEIYLYDAKTNKTINLSEQDYTFHSNATESANTTRFILTFSVTDATGIENVEDSKTESTDVYDLQGRKVQNASKGIFIQNGQKIVRK